MSLLSRVLIMKALRRVRVFPKARRVLLSNKLRASRPVNAVFEGLRSAVEKKARFRRFRKFEGKVNRTALRRVARSSGRKLKRAKRFLLKR